MSLTPEEKKHLEDIMHGMKCAKDFRCAARGFRPLCKVKDVGMDAFIEGKMTLECLDPEAKKCPFASSVTVGDEKTIFCQCPLRTYIAQKLKR